MKERAENNFKQEYQKPQITKYLSVKDITRDTTSITGTSTAAIDCPNHDDCGTPYGY